MVARPNPAQGVLPGLDLDMPAKGRGHDATPARVHTIDADRPFLDVLAASLIARHGDDPLALARVRVLLPTRRACRALRDAFLRRSAARALILPRLTPLGALDEDDEGFAEPELGDALTVPPAIAPAHRLLLLARLIRRGAGGPGGAMGPDQAVRLAAALAQLIDQVQTEQLPWSALDGLVGRELSKHWEQTVAFLRIVTEAWPAILAERGLIDPAERRNRLLLGQAEAWRASPPADPVIVAGSTGSVPASAALIAAVAASPQGAVVLPGLDGDLRRNPDGWAAIDQTHPQFGIRQLLERLDVAPEAVADWPRSAADGPDRADRRRLIGLAMRPAAMLALGDEGEAAMAAAAAESALAGVVRVDCAAPQEEASVIALALREALETPEATALLVTPDRDLAERVAAMLTRWGLAVDDSGGRPLAVTPVGAYLRLLLTAIEAALAPAELMALAKHPLAAAGQDPGRFRDATRRVERAILRGASPAPGLAGLHRRAAGIDNEGRRAGVVAWIDRVDAAIGSLAARAGQPEPQPFAELLAALVGAAEALAETDREAGADRLWAHEDGEAARALLTELAQAGGDADAMTFTAFAAAFEAFTATVAVRPAWGTHPRIAILGPLEARLMQADLVILGGLNEGVWPPEPVIDPWMSRPMRADFGLAQPERRIGQSAHDFAQAFAAPRVMLTRAARVGGAPTSPARWLRRLDAVLDQVAGQPGRLRPSTGPYRNWAAALDRPPAVRPRPRPSPKPPVAARPRELWVTQVEQWMCNPYAVYARHVLGLRKLDDLAKEAGAADFGNLVHEAIDRFMRDRGPVLPPGAAAELAGIGDALLADFVARPDLADLVPFWRARFRRIADWLCERLAEDGPGLVRLVTEAEGARSFAGPHGPFVLKARADRLDVGRNGRITVIDYKTGSPPKAQKVKDGYAPQLPLEGVIVRAGGFADVPADGAIALQYWQLKGRTPAGIIAPAGGRDADPAALVEEAEAGLINLIARFDDPSTGYVCRPRPRYAPRFDDYEHLARVAEWMTVEEEVWG